MVRHYSGAHVWILVWLVKDVVLATDRSVINITVSGHGSSEADSR
jgi:hypothetical protein